MGPVIKQYRPGKSVHQLERYIFWLERLQGTGATPDLLGVDRSSRAVLMSDCGEPISTLNAPHDWETQLAELMNQLRANQCAHNDLSEQEILVKDGQLRIVDFTFAHEINSDRSFPDTILPLGNFVKKLSFFLDDHIVNYVRFRLFGPPPGSEPHCFVLWNAEEHERIQEELSKKFEILRAIVYLPEIFGQLGVDRMDFLSKFYSGRLDSHGEKGLTPFVLYFVLDKDPRYEMRTNPTRGTQETVNVNVLDLTLRLRGNRSAFLHGSDSTQECFDNLEALTVYGGDVPKSYWLRWRPVFVSVSDFFGRANEVPGLEYVVLRNFESLMQNKLEAGSDIDILVNDFYLFKRFSGAIGYKHKRRERPGPAHEYGGYKVAGYVNIGGREVSIDIRYVGSGYYCEQWERCILAKRVRCESFYIPDSENLFYSLMYHALVHKRSVRDRYRRILGKMAPTIGKYSSIVDSDEQLWKCLDEFTQRQNYRYVRPKELSIPLSAGGKARIGVSTEDDMRAAQSFASRGRAFEAFDLLLGILYDEPDNKQARRLLAAVQEKANGSGKIRKLVRLGQMLRLGRMVPEGVKSRIKERFSI